MIKFSLHVKINHNRLLKAIIASTILELTINLLFITKIKNIFIFNKFLQIAFAQLNIRLATSRGSRVH